MRVKNTLDEWIALHEQEFIQDITALVEIPSVSVKGAVRRAERNAFGHCEKMLELGKNYGLETEMIGGPSADGSVWGKRKEKLDLEPSGYCARRRGLEHIRPLPVKDRAIF